MAQGLSSNRDNVRVKDRQILIGPGPDDGGASVPGEDTDTLGDISATKGRLAVADGSQWYWLPVGNNGEVLVADSAESIGMRWGSVPSGVVGSDLLGAEGTGLAGAEGTDLRGAADLAGWRVRVGSASSVDLSGAEGTEVEAAA